jgi:anti-sigma B factor antagonist
MKYSFDRRERFCIVKVDEDKLLSNSAPELKSVLTDLGKDGTKNVILDLANVQFVDSSGLSSLLVGNRIARESNGTFVITNISAHLQKLIKISQLESILTIIPTLEESIDYVMMEELNRDLMS